MFCDVIVLFHEISTPLPQKVFFEAEPPHPSKNKIS